MLFLLAALIAVASPSEPRWTFCIAEAGDDVWISDVFAPERAREKLEASFAQFLRGRGVASPVVQCPAPNADKEDVFNAQFTAAEFHRKLGQRLRAIDFPARER